MTGMDRAERDLFAKGVQDAVARTTGPATAPQPVDLSRSGERERSTGSPGGGLDRVLVELGWADALAADERTAVAVLFEAQGRTAARSGALDLLLARALGLEPGGAVVLPAFGATAPPGGVDGAVHGLVTGAVAAGGPVHVVCTTHDGTALVDVAVEDLALRDIGGLDPSLGLVEVTGTAVPATARSTTSVAWEAAVAAGQRAVAHELIGASAAMLDLAREHALERVQFDVPIASFQAIRHKLADTYVAVESARAALDAAWDEPSAFNAGVAKAIAGRGARLAAKHCQQVLAGIGFTTEHPLHRHVRRVRVLDGLFGDTRTLTRALGEQLLAAGGLPAILPL